MSLYERKADMEIMMTGWSATLTITSRNELISYRSDSAWARRK